MRVAVRSLGLSDVAPFDPAKKVVEEVLRDPDALVEQPVRRFVDMTSAGTAVPGGGSASALAAAQAAALLAMVANLSAVARGLEPRRAELAGLAIEAQAAKEAMLAAVDADSRAYASVMEARRLPKTTSAEKESRLSALAAASATAAAVPLSVLEKTIPLLEIASHLLGAGLEASLSDTGVAAAQAAAAAEGACYNVLVNLPGLADPLEAERTRARAIELCERARHLAADIRAVAHGRLRT